MTLTKFVLSCLIFSVVAFAQNQESNLTITIKNQLGEVIPEAEVLLFRDGTQLKSAKPNRQGVVRFLNLEPGDYLITISAKGFNDFKSEPLTVRIGSSKSFEATLDIKPIETDVAVGGADDVETDSAARVLDEKMIRRLPDDPTRLERLLRSMAGESADGEKMPITVDGQTDGKIPPKEQIQAVRINQNVFSAQYERANGWGIEIFSRSQVDKFSGSVRLGYDDSRLNAPDPFIGKNLPSRSHDLDFDFSGPLTKHSTFSFNIGRGNETSSKAVNATILDSQLHPTPFQTAFSYRESRYSVGASFNSDLNKKNKFTSNYYSYFNDSTGENVEGFTLPSRASNSENRYHNFRFGESFFASDSLINQFRGNLNYSSNRTFGGTNDVAINVLEAFEGGGAQNNGSRKNFGFELANDTSWQKNKYSANFGWQLRGTFLNQNSRENYGGTYTFSGRTAPVLDPSNNPIAGQTGQIDSLETYRRTLLLKQLGFSPAQIRLRGGGASQFTISDGNPEISASQINAAGYLQNTYKLKENLALSFGVRYENQTIINSNWDIAPRVGLIWSPKSKTSPDPKTDPKTAPKKKPNVLWTLPKISLGYGVFYRRFGAYELVPVKQATGADRATYLITDTNILDLFPSVTSVRQLQQFALPKTQRLISSHLQTPRMQMFNVNANKKLPAGFSANVGFSYSKSDRQSVTRNINAAFNGVRPLGNVGNVYETASIGRGERTRFSVTLSLPSEIVYGSIRYNWVKAKSNIVSGSGAPTNPFDFSREYGATSNDGVHSLNADFDYEIPIIGVNVYGSFGFSTGSRFNITTGRDTNGDGSFDERPSFATDLTKPGLISTKYGVLDPNPTANDQIIPRNLGRGVPNTSFDVYLSKSIGFGVDKSADKANRKPPKQTLSFSASIDNVFNIYNPSNPIGNISSPNFLKVLSGSNYNLVEFGENMYTGFSSSPRSVSFGISFRF